MKLMVLLKKTPDTETKIKLSADQKSIDTADIKYIINPYDEFAIEECLQIKERSGGDGEVVIVSFGDEGCREIIVKALAMGADRGLLVGNEGLENADSLVTAKILAAVINGEKPDLVICGKQAIDDDNMHVPTMVAELLKWPHVNVVTKLELKGSSAIVEREVEGGQVEVYELNLPVVLGAHKALNKPRYASLPNIMKAKKKPLDKKSVSDFGLNCQSLKNEIKTVYKNFRYPPQKAAGKVFKDEPVEVMATKLVKALREEAKVI